MYLLPALKICKKSRRMKEAFVSPEFLVEGLAFDAARALMKRE
jgi:hypothetical protein